jgi:hypothetical protein
VRDARLAPDFYAARNKTEERTGGKDIYAEIRALDELRKEGLLTDEEFEAQKKRVLESQK